MVCAAILWQERTETYVLASLRSTRKSWGRSSIWFFIWPTPGSKLILWQIHPPPPDLQNKLPRILQSHNWEMILSSSPKWVRHLQSARHTAVLDERSSLSSSPQPSRQPPMRPKSASSQPEKSGFLCSAFGEGAVYPHLSQGLTLLKASTDPPKSGKEEWAGTRAGPAYLLTLLF